MKHLLHTGRELTLEQAWNVICYKSVVEDAIACGDDTRAYVYSRMLARYYFRVLSSHSWYDAMRGAFTPNRPTMWTVESQHSMRFSVGVTMRMLTLAGSI